MTKKQEVQIDRYVTKKLEKTKKKVITIKYTVDELINEISTVDTKQKIEILKQIDPQNYEDILDLLEIDSSYYQNDTKSINDNSNLVGQDEKNN